MSDAIANAQAWLETIDAAQTALDRLEADDAPQTFEGETFDDADALRERLYQMPLAVDVRAGWHAPGERAPSEEYQILLTTGGPALRITGNLNHYNSPETVRVEYQDWGRPWTSYTLAQAEERRALAFASLFYFGA
jgi:hypothetical protein